MEHKEKGRKITRRDGKFYNSPVNTRIRERLKENGWTAVQLKELLSDKGIELTAEAVRQWISGYSQPKLDSIPTIADVLGCSVNYLFGGTNILQISAEAITLADLDFPEEAIRQLTARHLVSRNAERRQDQRENPDALRIHSAYTLLLYIMGKPEFWGVLDGLSSYIDCQASDWSTAIIETPGGSATISGEYIRDAAWASCIDPLRKIVDNALFVPDANSK